MLPRTFTNGESCEIANITPSQIEVWCRAGLLHPDAPGRGQHRRFDSDDLTVMILARELTRAGLNLPQLQRAFSVLRVKLATTPPAWRSVALFTDYVATMKLLARAFGPGDGYDQWLTEATAHLALLKRAAKSRRDDDATDAQVRDLLAAMSRLPPSGVTLRGVPA